jgi:hypothetical protein
MHTNLDRLLGDTLHHKLALVIVLSERVLQKVRGQIRSRLVLSPLSDAIKKKEKKKYHEKKLNLMQIHLHEEKILQIHNVRPEFVKNITAINQSESSILIGVITWTIRHCIIMILMWACPGNMPKYYPGLRDILPLVQVICQNITQV